MKFFAAASFLAATVAAVPLVARDAATIIQAISVVQNQTIKVNNTLNTFNPKSSGAVQQITNLYTDTNTLGTDIISATKAANASKPLNSDDSLNVGIAVLNYEPILFSFLDNLKAKKTALDSIASTFSARKTVLAELQLDKGLAQNLGDAIGRKVDPSDTQLAQAITSDIVNAIQSAVDVYSVQSKKVELPALPVGVTPTGQVY